MNTNGSNTSTFSELNDIWTLVDITKSSGGRFIEELLEKAGVEINGTRPSDIKIYKESVINAVLSQGNLGLGEAYMKGHWDCDSLDQFFCKILLARLDRQISSSKLIYHGIKSRLLNLQSVKRAWQVGLQHYDIGNRFYEAMLGRRMTYTCGYWSAGARNLEEAQEAKLDLICRKLGLKPGMRLLDIGCGWGSLMGYAAEHYGVDCVGVTISKEQAEYGQKKYQNLPIEFRLADYRSLNEKFDRIASVGMFEHVGQKNYQQYMEVAHRCLTDDGIFLLHTIGKNVKGTPADPWIDKYIFPNGILPAMSEVNDAIGELFILEDVHNFGADYDKTLMAWYENFVHSWHEFSEQMDDRFFRMWSYYLLSCAGAFRARDIQLWQFVLSKNGISGGYTLPKYC